MLIDELLPQALEYKERLQNVKREEQPDQGWYPHDSISNLWHLDRLLPPGARDVSQLLAGRVADVGAADGEVAHFLAGLGIDVDVVDHSATNWNGLDGARRLGRLLSTDVAVHDVDLDSQFRMPAERYSLIIFLGILYHLKNPFYVLEQMVQHSDHLFLSTRVARQTADGGVRLADAPVAYLVDPFETNGDPTNFWIFSLPGLRRLVRRAGWDVLQEMTVGHTADDSDPTNQDKDERAFMLLRRRR